MYILRYLTLGSIFLIRALFSGQSDLEVRVGLSHFTKSLLFEIYGKAAFDAELEYHYKQNRYVTYFVNLSNVNKQGYTIGFDNKSHLNLLSLSVGPRFLFRFKNTPCLTPYLGIGMTGSWIHTHDQGENIINTFDKGAFGPCFKSGIIWSRSQFYVDLFFDYYIQYAKNFEHDYVNFSNLKSGVGIGYVF